MNVSFTVYGTPQPQGSTRAFMPKRGKNPIVTSDNARNKPWRQQVALTAQEYCRTPLARPEGVMVKVICFLKPPAKMPKGRTCPSCKPDVDKLLRSFLDAMSGIAYEDDSQVVSAQILKVYGLPERAEISLARAAS